VAYVDGRSGDADRLHAGIQGSGGGGQAKIAMSCHGHALQGQAGGYRQSRCRWLVILLNVSHFTLLYTIVISVISRKHMTSFPVELDV